MQYKNESQLNLRFLKTFALAAERLADAGAGQNVPVGQYAEYVKTLSTEYPALENLALKLNVQVLLFRYQMLTKKMTIVAVRLLLLYLVQWRRK